MASMGSQKPRHSVRERLGRALTVLTPKGSAPAPATKRIRQISKFGDLYVLGKEVMPCGHRYMTVHFGMRKKDGVECVIKRRYKPHGFSTKADEMSWRRSTEYLLNVPESGNIAKIYEVLEDSHTFYIVMEKVHGMDLFETLASEEVTVETAREIIQQLLRAMAHLHSNSAVHKDLKLENVMVDASELSPRNDPFYTSNRSDFSHMTSMTSMTSRSSTSLSPTSVKVIDFDTVDEFCPSSPPPKDVVGTDQYIAQEAYAGKYSPSSDIFAVGVIAFKLLSRKFPFDAKLFDDKPGENWVGSPKMLEIREKLTTTKVDFSHPVFAENPMAANLVRGMLSHSEEARPSAAKALEHQWFQEEALTAGPTLLAAQALSLPKLVSGDVVTGKVSFRQDSTDSGKSTKSEADRGDSSLGSTESTDLPHAVAQEGSPSTPCRRQIGRFQIKAQLSSLLPSSLSTLRSL